MLGLSGIRKKTSLSLEEKVYLYLVRPACMGGVWYGHNPRNRMICTCKFVVMTVIVGACSLELHAEKFASIHNCPYWRAFHVKNVGEDQIAKLSAEIMDICCRGVAKGGD